MHRPLQRLYWVGAKNPTMRDRYFQLFSDEALVRKAQMGSLKAYDELVHRFRNAVVLVAEQRRLSRTAAEDAAQEVFVLAFKSLTRLKEPEKFAGWLYAITRHHAYRVAMRERRSIATDPTCLDRLRDDSAEAYAAGPESLYLEKQQAAEVSHALEDVKPEYRTVLLLRYEEEWSIARIARFLSLPATTVNWRLHQARKFLKQGILQQQKENDYERGQPIRSQPSGG